MRYMLCSYECGKELSTLVFIYWDIFFAMGWVVLSQNSNSSCERYLLRPIGYRSSIGQGQIRNKNIFWKLFELLISA